MYVLKDVAEALDVNIDYLEHLLTQENISDPYVDGEHYEFDSETDAEYPYTFTRKGLEKLLTEDSLTRDEIKAVKDLLAAQPVAVDTDALALDIIHMSRNQKQTTIMLQKLLKLVGIPFSPYVMHLPELSFTQERIVVNDMGLSFVDTEAFILWLCPHYAFGYRDEEMFVQTITEQSDKQCITFTKRLLVCREHLIARMNELYTEIEQQFVKGNYVAQKSYLFFNIYGMEIKIPYSKK